MIGPVSDNGDMMTVQAANAAISSMQADIDTRLTSSALSGYVTTAALTAALATAGVSVTRLTATLGSGGTVTIAHGKSVAPVIVPLSRFSGDQEFVAVVGAVTATQVTLTGKRSRGTLLLTSGPFEAAASGDSVEVLVIGR